MPPTECTVSRLEGLTRDLNHGPVSRTLIPLSFRFPDGRRKMDGKRMARYQMSKNHSIIDGGQSPIKCGQQIILRVDGLARKPITTHSGFNLIIESNTLPNLKIQLRVFRKAHFVVFYNPVFLPLPDYVCIV